MHGRHLQAIWQPNPTPGQSVRKPTKSDPKECPIGAPRPPLDAPSAHRMCKGHPLKALGCPSKPKVDKNHTKLTEWIRIYTQSDAEIVRVTTWSRISEMSMSCQNIVNKNGRPSGQAESAPFLVEPTHRYQRFIYALALAM